MVAGMHTDAGKTLVSAILAIMFRGDYWKPVQCGSEETSDSALMRQWLQPGSHIIHPPSYSFHTHASPHYAAQIEERQIDPNKIVPPQTTRPLIIEGVGGVFVPLTEKILTIDLFSTWDCHWVIVSRHYLGSINHTLLTIEALKQRRIPILGIIFNGDPNPGSESAILEISHLPFLGRLLPESHLNRQLFQRYADTWQPHFSKIHL